MNFLIWPSVIRAFVPREFELDLYADKACVSLVWVIMRNYRRAPNAPLWGGMFSAIKEQRFMNLRTYVRHHGEPGAFFFWGWLSQPLGLPIPDEPFGLTCAFANFRGGCISRKSASLVYDAQAVGVDTSPCLPGSVNELALERYSGFFA